MSYEPCRRAVPCHQGFTLIEVIAALVIFSLGVLMVLRLTSALTAQMEYAATSSELVVRSEEPLDSLEALPFTSLVLGTTIDTLTIRGAQYLRTVTISEVTELLYQIEVTVARLDGGDGPSLAVTSYAGGKW